MFLRIWLGGYWSDDTHATMYVRITVVMLGEHWLTVDGRLVRYGKKYIVSTVYYWRQYIFFFFGCWRIHLWFHVWKKNTALHSGNLLITILSEGGSVVSRSTTFHVTRTKFGSLLCNDRTGPHSVWSGWYMNILGPGSWVLECVPGVKSV